jgi:hypothetical protein
MIAVYRIYRKDSSKIKQEKHGDVLLCVENDIIICDCDDLNEIQAESIWCKIVNKTDKSAEVVVGVCYRRPAAEAKEINIKKLQSTFKRSCYRPCSHRSKTAKIKRERERGRERDSGNSSSYEAYNTIA